MDEQPNSPNVYSWLVNHYTRTKQYNKGIEILQKWLQVHPTDNQAQSQLAQLQSLAALEDSSKVEGDTGSNDSVKVTNGTPGSGRD
jgi:predicted Zn-dependent protease